jgi:hypothetical protein
MHRSLTDASGVVVVTRLVLIEMKGELFAVLDMWLRKALKPLGTPTAKWKALKPICNFQFSSQLAKSGFFTHRLHRPTKPPTPNPHHQAHH